MTLIRTKDAGMWSEQRPIAFECKMDDDGLIEGYASRFGEVDQGGDIVVAGAFAKTLASGRMPKMLWQHDPSQPIGKWESASEDETGLYVKGRIMSEIEKGREVLAMVKGGVIDGMSIGYRTIKQGRGASGERMLQEVELWEISMVTFPMLPTARVQARKAMEDFQAGAHGPLKRLIEATLREAGVSRSEAKAGASAAVNKLASLRDAGTGLDELAQFMRQFSTGQGV